MNILISAYSCEPGISSKLGINWHIIREIANYHQVWVLTRLGKSWEAIETELARNPIPNLHFVSVTLPFWQDIQRQQTKEMQLHYYLWQIQVYFVARRLHQKIGFDLIHDVSFGNYFNPSFLSLMPLPLVWGPIGSGESAPASFWQDFSLRAKIYEIVRSTKGWLKERDPFLHLTTKRSAVIRATTKNIAERLYKLGASQVQVIPESGLSEEDIARLAKYEIPDGQTIKFISIGRLQHWQGFHLGLRAFAQANLPNAEYWIVGEGEELKRLQILAQDLQVAHKVKFWGKLSREKTLDLLRDCHVLVHPRLHSSGGWECIEAMAAGRPVLCLNLGEPAIQVTNETGIKIPANEPYQAVRDLAAAMLQLAKEPELKIKMGQAGQARVSQHYSWKVMGKQLNQLYTGIVHQANTQKSL
ncbi:glycosyltransferase family 4 protein [Aliterella atlantica]|uniref:Glycosyl transferase family 1 n=1 Tax=Aliterella atlantica CENA595 TaxID=1618023 RepID=A0A0D8ZWL0_9CYAN|nr:glycosyltransferase family 4 protein [Aliterella atlantica]KJH73145.1 glycosyl transferase family 1 [Aliterella atlantica CENA595]